MQDLSYHFLIVEHLFEGTREAWIDELFAALKHRSMFRVNLTLVVELDSSCTVELVTTYIIPRFQKDVRFSALLAPSDVIHRSILLLALWFLPEFELIVDD